MITVTKVVQREGKLYQLKINQEIKKQKYRVRRKNKTFTCLQCYEQLDYLKYST